MLHAARAVVAIALAASLAGCGLPRALGVAPYTIEIQQGNFISQETVSQLKEGMSKEQVRQIMGTPLLVDVFHAERWDYMYSRVTSDGRKEKRGLVLFFEDGKLTRFDGEAALARGAKPVPALAAAPAAAVVVASAAPPAAAAVTLPPATEAQARYWVYGAFLTQAEPEILSERVALGPEVEQRLGIVSGSDRAKIYEALMALMNGKPLSVHKATEEEVAKYSAATSRELKETLFAVQAGDVKLLVQYDLEANTISFVGELSSLSASQPSAVGR
jgi:outer membrane protein assembly factor BamE